MLCREMRAGEGIQIGCAQIVILRVRGGRVKLGIAAAPVMPISQPDYDTQGHEGVDLGEDDCGEGGDES